MPQATCSNLLAPAADCPLLRPLLAKELGRERTGAGCAHVRAGRCVQPEQARSMSGSGGSAGSRLTELGSVTRPPSCLGRLSRLCPSGDPWRAEPPRRSPFLAGADWPGLGCAGGHLSAGPRWGWSGWLALGGDRGTAARADVCDESGGRQDGAFVGGEGGGEPDGLPIRLRGPRVRSLGDGRGQAADAPALPGPRVLVVGVVEDQRRDADGDEVAPVDPGEAARGDRPDAEVLRYQRGVLPGRALAVVVPADDDP